MVQLTRTQSEADEHRDSGAGLARRTDDLSDNSHRQLIGYIGLFLPFILIFLVVTRNGLADWKKLDSISAYYYTGAVAAFVGMLVALALFLLTYRGYKNESYWADRAAGIIAGIAALGVALFPTAAPEGIPALPWWTPIYGMLHYASAIVLFAMFAVFALWLFRKSAEGQPKSPDKKRHNGAYLFCGLVIVASMIWAGIAGTRGDSIFWPESFALMFFAFSWLVKGQALASIGNATRTLFRQNSKPAE